MFIGVTRIYDAMENLDADQCADDHDCAKLGRPVSPRVTSSHIYIYIYIYLSYDVAQHTTGFQPQVF